MKGQGHTSSHMCKLCLRDLLISCRVGRVGPALQPGSSSKWGESAPKWTAITPEARFTKRDLQAPLARAQVTVALQIMLQSNRPTGLLPAHACVASLTFGFISGMYHNEPEEII